jgi:hypothetical protein
LFLDFCFSLTAAHGTVSITTGTIVCLGAQCFFAIVLAAAITNIVVAVICGLYLLVERRQREQAASQGSAELQAKLLAL